MQRNAVWLSCACCWTVSLLLSLHTMTEVKGSWMCAWVWGKDMHIVALGQFEVGYKWICSYMFHTCTFHCEPIWWIHIIFNNLQVQLFPPSGMNLSKTILSWASMTYCSIFPFTVIQTSFSATVNLRWLITEFVTTLHSWGGAHSSLEIATYLLPLASVKKLYGAKLPFKMTSLCLTTFYKS